jgi:hypothetical protein
MTNLRSLALALVAMLVGACGDPMVPTPEVPAPVVPAEGQFVWTAGGVTVTASDSVMLFSQKAAGYRFSGPSLVIEAATEDLRFCTLITSGTTLPAPGSYPVGGVGAGTFEVRCNDPTSAFVGTYLDVIDGTVVVTKAEPGDLEGTFTLSTSTHAATGGFNVGCIYADCTSPR